MNRTVKIASSGRHILKLGRRGGQLVTRCLERLMGRWFEAETFEGRVVFDRGRWRGLTFDWDRHPRARLNPIGAVMKARLGGYMKLRRAFLDAHPTCERCGKVPSRDVHHTRGRAGDLLTEVQWWVALCRGCHNWATEHPVEAQVEMVCGIPLVGLGWNHEAEGGRTDVSKSELEQYTKRLAVRHRKAFEYGNPHKTPTKPGCVLG